MYHTLHSVDFIIFQGIFSLPSTFWTLSFSFSSPLPIPLYTDFMLRVLVIYTVAMLKFILFFFVMCVSSSFSYPWPVCFFLYVLVLPEIGTFSKTSQYTNRLITFVSLVIYPGIILGIKADIRNRPVGILHIAHVQESV